MATRPPQTPPGDPLEQPQQAPQQPEQQRTDLIARLCRTFAQRAISAAGWAESRAVHRESRLSEEAQSARQAPSQEQVNTNRRRFFGAAVIAAASATAAAAGVKTGIDKRLLERAQSEKEKLLGVPETREWEPSELTDNWVASFELIHGALDNRHVVFVDQNGNIIDSPIGIGDHVFPGDSEPTKAINPDGTLNQEWLNKCRELLKKKYPTIHLDLTDGNEHPSLYQVRRAVNDSETVFAVAWQNALTPLAIENGQSMTKLEYAEEAFKKSDLPTELQELIIFGICGIESMFKDDLISDAGASGAWQFMPETAKEHGLIQKETKIIKERVRIKRRLKKRQKRRKKPKETWATRTRKVTIERDYRQDFVKSTDAAVLYCESLYRRLKYDCVELAERFHLSDEDSLYPCVIAAYNNGSGRVQKMITWFLRNYPLERVEKEIGNGPYGMDIFTHMTLRYRSSKTDPKYGKQSKDYFPKAVSMHNLFMERMKNSPPEFEPYEPPEIPDDTLSAISKFHQQALDATAGVTGAAFGLAAGMIASPKPVGRRGALLAGASLAGAAAGTAIGSQSLSTEAGEEIQEIPEPDWGRIKRNKELGRHLLDISRLFDSTLENKAVKLPRRIQKTKIEPWIKEQRQLRQYENTREAIEAAQRGELAPLKEYDSMHYRCRGVGISKGDQRKNDKDFLNVHPNMPAAIQEIDERLNEELAELGFPPNYWARLIITCGIRPVDYNAKTKGSSPESAHTYGVAFDLSRRRFDIIDKNTGTFYDTPDELGVNQKHRITAQMYAALTRVLRKMSDEGKIFVNHESDHIHIVIKQI